MIAAGEDGRQALFWRAQACYLAGNVTQIRAAERKNRHPLLHPCVLKRSIPPTASTSFPAPPSKLGLSLSMLHYDAFLPSR